MSKYFYYFQNIFRTWSHLRHGDNIFTTNLDLHANQIGLFKLKALSYIYISYYNNIVYLFLFPGDFHLNWISFTLYKFKCIHLILTFVARRELSGYDKLPLTYICNVFIFYSFPLSNMKNCSSLRTNSVMMINIVFLPRKFARLQFSVYSVTRCYLLSFYCIARAFKILGKPLWLLTNFLILQELNYLISIR